MPQVSLLTLITISLILPSHNANNYQIFYRFPGYEQALPLDLDSDDTVGNIVEEIIRVHQIQKGYEIQISYGDDILRNEQSMADVGISTDAVIVITIIPLTPAQQIFKALENSNFKQILGLNGNEENCSDFNPIVTCDQSGNPIKISVIWHFFRGSVDLSLLPDTIQDIHFNIMFTGNIDFLHLPRDLRTFSILNSQFTADLSHMQKYQWPKNLTEIHWRNNDLFYGDLDCSELPRSLTILDIGGIKQLNAVTFRDLPLQLNAIHLDNNALNGLDLSEALPISLKTFDLRNTEIYGEIKLKGIQKCTSLNFWVKRFVTQVCARLKVAAIDSCVSVNFFQ